MNPSFKRIVLISLTLLVSSPSWSQQQAGLEEVVVTARKVSENLQDVPISVAAFSGEALAQRQIFGTEDLDQITPNLQFAATAPISGNNSASQVFIRGIGQTDPTAGVDPGVGIYLDDVYMGQSVGGAMDLSDIASVQVLRGPQGTLFGRNTIGGAILLTTTEPGDELATSIRAKAGTDSLFSLLAAIDIPLSDRARSRFTLGRQVRDGYVTRNATGEDLGDDDVTTMTGKLVWEANQAWSTTFKFDYTDEDENGAPLVFAAYNEGAPFGAVASANAGCPGAALGTPVPLIDDPRCANDFQNAGPFRNNGTKPLQSTLENLGLSAAVEYQHSDTLTFKSITAWREVDWRGVRDADNTPLRILHTDIDSNGEQFSQELQALFSYDRINGVVGVYYQDEEVDDIFTVELTIPPKEQTVSNNNFIENENKSIFTQWTFELDESWSLTAGARYSDETKAALMDQFDFDIPEDKFILLEEFEKDFSDTTIAASIGKRWSPQVNTYLSYSEGFKSGGWNTRYVIPTADLRPLEFDQETAETIEFGWKLDLLNNSLRLNGAIFSTDYEDLQFTFRVGPTPVLFNAGEAKIDGMEVELTWIPDDHWTIDAGLGYLDASIEEVADVVGASTSITTDSELPYTPEYQGHLGIAYHFDLDSGSLRPRVDIAYRDSQFFDTANTVEIAQTDSETTVNASVSYAPNNGNWHLVLGVNNLTDEVYPVAGNSSLSTATGYAEIAYARPREWFVSVNFDF